MHPVLRKSFGGLSQAYFLRELFFGLLMAAFVCWMASYSSIRAPMQMALFVMVSTVLYPYSRFVYQSIAGCIGGRNERCASAALVLGMKTMTMILCWAGAVVIAPIGLAYLYFHHSKTDKQEV